jgi:trimethylamine--corrinoid protein Co-methyltransferase
LGCLDSILGFSPEKMILDEEIYARCAHMMAGPSLNEADYGVDLLHEVGPGGSFITHRSTMANFRKLWTPTVSHWDTYHHWEESGKKTVAARAAAIVEERLASARSDYLEASADKAIEELVNKRA